MINVIVTIKNSGINSVFCFGPILEQFGFKPREISSGRIRRLCVNRSGEAS